MNELKDTITTAATKLETDALHAAGEMKDHAKEAWNSAQKETKRAVRVGAEYAHDHPLPIALVAAGLGVAFGFFLHRRGLLCGLLFAGGAYLSQSISCCESPASTDAAKSVA